MSALTTTHPSDASTLASYFCGMIHYWLRLTKYPTRDCSRITDSQAITFLDAVLSYSGALTTSVITYQHCTYWAQGVKFMVRLSTPSFLTTGVWGRNDSIP